MSESRSPDQSKHEDTHIGKLTSEIILKEITGSDGAIDLSSLKKMGGGGTHDIYKLENHPNFLLKVMKHTVGKEAAELFEKMQKLNEQYAVLYKIFGPTRCIIEKRSIQSIRSNGSEQSAQKSIISVVPFDTCFESKEKFGFNVGSAELDGRLIASKRYLYERVNKSLLSNNEKPNQYVMINYPLLNKEFERIFKLMDTDESLAMAMREFLTSYRNFYRKSGILLDTIGFDNVLFYKSDGIWQFKLGSVIKHDTGELTKKILSEIVNNPKVVNESFEFFTSIYFMPACIRALNACATKLGMERVIDDINISEQTINVLAEMHNQLGEVHRIINNAEHGDFSAALKLYNRYIETETSYDSKLREMLGTLYWDFIKKGGKITSRDEIETYLKMLCDERNNFADFISTVVEEAIDGLKRKILSLDSLTRQSIFKPLQEVTNSESDHKPKVMRPRELK